jgi:hypothetical protein
MKPKYLLGFALIVAAVVFLIVTSMQANAQYFLTVSQLHDRGQAVVDQSVRVSGAVVFDDTVLYEVRNNEPYLEFGIGSRPRCGLSIRAPSLISCRLTRRPLWKAIWGPMAISTLTICC